MAEPAEPLHAGQPWPMGAHADAGGVNVAVFSTHAERIELCVFDDTGETLLWSAPLPACTGGVHHGYVRGARPGMVYGLRAHGPWAPEEGHRFNPAKLLLDPYAREIVGRFEWRDEHFGGLRDDPLAIDARDNAAFALKARVTADTFDWGDDRPPLVPAADTVICELHVKAFSKANPAVPEALRGSYAGLGHEASIAHLKRLGVTTLSVLPVHYHLDEERLAGMGLVNHWGYNTIGFFAPDPKFSSTDSGAALRDEFRQMVKNLHAAGIEVLLDVVFNHTAEGGGGGPTISFRGLDNLSYYRLPHDDRAGYDNDSGCGNTFDLRCPHALQLTMDSLRHWVTDMHVDGYRFDLAPVLGRGDEGFDRHGAFFTAVAQDPVLSRVKMIAEPWHIGLGGYQVGGFPRGWGEWNDRFRDTMRDFWLRGGQTRGDWARRFCGSSDIFQHRGRLPHETVNYTVSHDGFTLRDLVSYQERHNEANGENNADGTGNNLSTNCGAEGASDDPGVLQRRARLQRALLATTLLAQGTPMFWAGDELGHSQQGNNNPYCQDNAITWIDWTQADDDLIEFTALAIELRKRAQPLDDHWYSGLTDPLGLHDLTWLDGTGALLEGEAWNDPVPRALGCLIGQPGRAKAPLLLLMNASADDMDFLLPAGVWEVLLDTTHPRGVNRWHGQGEAPFMLPAMSFFVLAAAGADIKL